MRTVYSHPLLPSLSLFLSFFFFNPTSLSFCVWSAARDIWQRGRVAGWLGGGGVPGPGKARPWAPTADIVAGDKVRFRELVPEPDPAVCLLCAGLGAGEYDSSLPQFFHLQNGDINASLISRFPSPDKTAGENLSFKKNEDLQNTENNR